MSDIYFSKYFNVSFVGFLIITLFNNRKISPICFFFFDITVVFTRKRTHFHMSVGLRVCMYV